MIELRDIYCLLARALFYKATSLTCLQTNLPKAKKPKEAFLNRILRMEEEHGNSIEWRTSPER